LLALLAVLGGAGIVLLYRLGGSIDLILRENYDSVIAMEHLNEALERIDSSFQFALAGEEEKARAQYDKNWIAYRESLEVEQHNITLPGEQELVDELVELTERYRRQGDDFYGTTPAVEVSTTALLGAPLGQGPLLAASALLPGRSLCSRPANVPHL